MATFSERLKLLREEKGITLDELANAIQSTKSTLSRYENEWRTPKIEFAERVANYFSVSVDYLLGKAESRKGANEEPISDAIEEPFPKDIRIMMRDAAELTQEQRKVIHSIINEFKQTRKKKE
jgi:transcriptional regulator with XRE-family HTH domain